MKKEQSFPRHCLALTIGYYKIQSVLKILKYCQSLLAVEHYQLIMAKSGIQVDQDLKDEFNQLKQNKLKPRIQLLVMGLSDDKKHVVKKPDLCLQDCSADEMREFFSDSDRKNSCYYVIFDFNSKLILIKWTPDTAKAGDKMIFASTFDSVKLAFDGVKGRIEATDLDDLTDEECKRAKS